MADGCTATEMMTVAAARALRDDDVCFVGIGLPSAACNLARLTHAPGITLIYESGTIATRPAVSISILWSAVPTSEFSRSTISPLIWIARIWRWPVATIFERIE